MAIGNYTVTWVYNKSHNQQKLRRMKDFYIGIITTIAIIGLVEIARFFEKRLVGALTLVGIAFIYIGFSWSEILSLTYAILGASVFFTLSYFGYKKNFILIVVGLILHGIWDILFPLFSSAAPEGYGIFCLTVDFLLAIYFYARVKPLKYR
jgi:uncharacterized protein DUF6010